MPKFRTAEAITYVHKGKVISVDRNRVIDLDDAQAKKLGSKVALIEDGPALMFPDGAPILTTFAVEPDVKAEGELVSSLPQPKKVAPSSAPDVKK